MCMSGRKTPDVDMFTVCLPAHVRATIVEYSVVIVYRRQTKKKIKKENV